VVAVVCVRVSIEIGVAVARVRVAITMMVSMVGMSMVDYLMAIRIGGVRVSCWFRVGFRRGVS